MGAQTDVVDANGVLLGVVVEDTKRGGFVALLTFEFLLADIDYDTCWTVGTFPSRTAAETAIEIAHNAFKNGPRRRAEHDRLLTGHVAANRRA